MKHFYIHIPGWAHAMSCYGYSKKDARARFRKQHDFSRLPKGTTIWVS